MLGATSHERTSILLRAGTNGEATAHVHIHAMSQESSVQRNSHALASWCSEVGVKAYRSRILASVPGSARLASQLRHVRSESNGQVAMVKLRTSWILFLGTLRRSSHDNASQRQPNKSGRQRDIHSTACAAQKNWSPTRHSFDCWCSLGCLPQLLVASWMEHL